MENHILLKHIVITERTVASLENVKMGEIDMSE